MLNKAEVLFTHPECVPFSFDHANCTHARDYIYFLLVHLLMLLFASWKLLLSLRCKNALKLEARLTAPCRRARGFLTRHTSIRLSSGMNICGVAVFSHSRRFLYSFIKINFTWMSDFICCHNLDCRYSIYRYYCAMENKCKTNHNELCVFHFILFFYTWIFWPPQVRVAVLDHYVLLKDFWGSSDTDLIVLMDSFRIRVFKRVS